MDERDDVENTTKELNDIFINTIDPYDLDEPDPAIVTQRTRKIPSVTDWPGLEDGRIATA